MPGLLRLVPLFVLLAALALASQAGASAPASSENRRAEAAGGVASIALAGRARIAPRSRIVRTNRGFSCTRPLARIARSHGRGLPLLVHIKFTRYVNLEPAVIELRRGCRGDGNSNTIDLILKVDGNGRTKGGTVDAIKLREDPHDIQITGYANCGPQGVGPDGRPDTDDDQHQDGAQIQGGSRIAFIGFTWGKWKKRKATCQGAAGTFVPGSVNNWPVRNISCIRCRSVSCNHGMLISRSVDTVVRNSKWRSGNPAERRRGLILANGQTGLCNFGSDPCVVSQGEAISLSISGNFCDKWPYSRRH